MADIPRRNVYVFGSSNGAEVAGFFQHGGVSISTFIGWINEVAHIPTEWALYPCQYNNNRGIGGAALVSDKSTQVNVFLTTDVSRTRAYSANYTYTPHDTKFVKRVRARDSRCCITGDLVAGEDYTGFEAAHIFPPSETDIWNDLDYGRFIKDDKITPGSEIGSIQQGFLCSSTEHRMFDNYSIGVNPDDEYRIFDFVGRDSNRTPHGRIFYRNTDEYQDCFPSVDLLRDHFKQCVLQNVKGAGESSSTQRHFDPDIDLHGGGFNLAAGSWWSGPEGKRRLEAELAGRLWGSTAMQIQIDEVDEIHP